MSKINTYNIMINKSVNGDDSFEVNLFVPFTPRKMVVDYITYYDDNTEGSYFILRANGLLRNEQRPFLGIARDIAMSTPRAEFTLGYQVSGSYNIDLLDPTLAFDSNRIGDLCISLTFYK